MDITTPIVDFVQSYRSSGVSRLHMPGHKGHGGLGCELCEPFDITEICGADELYAADGIIAESEANASKLFGTERTFYSTEGSSQCIRAMLCLALQAAYIPRGSRPVLLAARNAHKALIYAAALLDFDIEWLWPEHGRPGGLCSCYIPAGSLAAALARMKAENRLPFGVYVTSPDYLGGIQDIEALAAVCLKYALPLLVDNAHGAYLRFMPGESEHPIELGAAMCCDSAHKTLPVLTGGAYLHFGKNAPVRNEKLVRNALALFGSTSPSYLILQSLDMCNAMLAGSYPERLRLCIDKICELKAEINAAAVAAGCAAPFALAGDKQEKLKITLDAAAIGFSGGELARLLRAHNVECEYADPQYVVLMPTPENSPLDFERVREALLDAIAACIPGKACGPENDNAALAMFTALQAQAKQSCTIRQAALSPQEQIPVDEALGRVCAMPAVSCPPAIPIAVSGEAIGAAAIAVMEKYGISTVAVLK